MTGSGVGALIRWGVAPLVLLPKDCLPELLELALGVSLLLTVVEILETAARRPDLCLPADLTALPDVCCGSEAVASAVLACSLALTEGGVDTEASSNKGRCPAAGNGVIAGACAREVKESSAAGCKAGAAGATEAALKQKSGQTRKGWMPRRFAGGMGRGAALLEGCQGCHHSPCRLAVAVPSPEIPTVNGKAQ